MRLALRQPNRSRRTYSEPPCRSTARLAALNLADNPNPKINRTALAHDPPPNRVNHKSLPKGIPGDSDFRSDALDRILGNARHLKPRLGPILYQLPPRWRFNRDRLDQFLQLLPKDLVHVIEFRDESWQTEEALALLDAYGVGFCTHDMPGMKVRRWASGKAAYVRFHGGVGKYHGRYPDEILQGWADWMIAQAAAGRPVWAYFNNDYEAHAVHDALTLRSMVRQAAR